VLKLKLKIKLKKIYANKEIILSGGSINSPQLLMVSGVGPGEHLKENNIDVVHDLKGVGKNLQDHLETYIQQECKTQILYIHILTNKYG
jgi:choline dehydrogenase